jgi:hypothetical protein
VVTFKTLVTTLCWLCFHLNFACTDLCHHILFDEEKQEKIRTRDETGRKEEKRRREKEERT